MCVLIVPPTPAVGFGSWGAYFHLTVRTAPLVCLAPIETPTFPPGASRCFWLYPHTHTCDHTYHTLERLIAHLCETHGSQRLRLFSHFQQTRALQSRPRLLLSQRRVLLWASYGCTCGSSGFLPCSCHNLVSMVLVPSPPRNKRNRRPQ